MAPSLKQQKRERNLQDQLDRQERQISIWKDVARRCVRDLATIRKNEVVERVWDLLQTMAVGVSQVEWDIEEMRGDVSLASGVSGPPQRQKQKQKQKQKQTSVVHEEDFQSRNTVPVVSFQQRRQAFVGEMVAFGYGPEADIGNAFDVACGSEELAVSILTSVLSLPATPESQAGDVEQRWDGPVPPLSLSTLEGNNGQGILYGALAPGTPVDRVQDQGVARQWDPAPLNNVFQQADEQDIVYNVNAPAPTTPVNRKRKADSSFATTTPSSSTHHHHHHQTPSSQSPLSPNPTTTPHPTHSPRTYLARRKPSSLSPQEQTALFHIIKRLAPSNKTTRFWGKVTTALAQLGYVKSEAAWKGEWSRYGTYEHGFDERTGVFVGTEVERLRLLRCLDERPRAEVRRVILELEGGDGDGVVGGEGKRRKVRGAFEGGSVDVVQTPVFSDLFDGDFAGVGGGFVPVDEYAWLADLDFSRQEKYNAGVGFIGDLQDPALQERFDNNNNNNFPDFSNQQYVDTRTPHFDVPITNNTLYPNNTILNNLQNTPLFQNINEWFSTSLNQETTTTHNNNDDNTLNIEKHPQNTSKDTGDSNINSEHEANVEGNLGGGGGGGAVDDDNDDDDDDDDDENNPYIISLREFERNMVKRY
ncbi:hypothetical protein Vi05172_g4736 [Venturia inaequalis]|nr:hypothetical protein Vi05172_g4736 [Venturia inaequalis]